MKRISLPPKKLPQPPHRSTRPQNAHPRRASVKPEAIEVEDTEETLAAKDTRYYAQIDLINQRSLDNINLLETRKKSTHMETNLSNKHVKFLRQNVREFDALSPPDSFLSSKRVYAELNYAEPSGKFKEPISKAEKFGIELERCLLDPTAFTQFYVSCINFLKKKRQDFNEFKLSNKKILKYILACADEMGLNFDDDPAFKEQATQVILEMLSDCALLKDKYDELAYLKEQANLEEETTKLDADLARLDAELAELDAEKSPFEEEAEVSTTPHSPKESDLGSAAALAILSLGATQSPCPPPSEFNMAAAGSVLQQVPAVSQTMVTHTPKPPAK
jgi:hypothetical protein